MDAWQLNSLKATCSCFGTEKVIFHIDIFFLDHSSSESHLTAYRVSDQKPARPMKNDYQLQAIPGTAADGIE